MVGQSRRAGRRRYGDSDRGDLVTKPKDPSHTRLDRFAPLQLRRKHQLRPLALLLLLTLTLLADFRDGTWRGTFSDLAGELGTWPRTLNEAMNQLVDAGLVRVEEEFVGRGQTGLVRVLVYEELIVRPPPRPARDSSAQRWGTCRSSARCVRVVCD